MRKFFKKWALPIAIFVIVVLSSTFAKSINNVSYLIGSQLPWDLSNLIKRLFLYSSEEDIYFSGYNFFLYINFTAVIIFGTCHSTLSMYGMSKKYRGLIMLRYVNKRGYVWFNQRQGIKSCATIGLAILLGVVIGAAITGCKDISAGEITSLALLCVNIFIYFALVALLNIYLVIAFGEMIGLGVVLIFGMAAILLDLRIKLLAIITYGNIMSLCVGLGSIILIYGILSYVIKKKIQYMDML